MEGGGIEPTQPLVLSQTQPEIDPAIHARLVSLVPAVVPSADMKSDALVVGRDPDASQVVVTDKRVSGRHVRIYRDDVAYYVEALGTGPTWHQGRQMNKGDVRTLASGDSISLLYNMSAIADMEKPKESVADFLFQVIGPKPAPEESGSVESRYQILKELGSGNFSKVLLGVDRRDARRKVAVKKICVEVFEKFRRKRGTKLTLKSETEVLRSLEHPNMVQLLDVFEREGELCLVMELCEGGDLLHNILDQGAFSEYRGRKLFRDLLGAVRHLHERHIVHRDLKPENVLLTSCSRESTVAKITDFGLAVQLGEEPDAEAAGAAAAAREQAAEAMQQLRARATMCRTFCGTPHYFAPEVIMAGRAERTSYGKEVDMWSMGVMLYIILSAVPPFDEESGNMEALYGRICNGQWEFDAEEFDRVSAVAKELVSNLMRVKSSERLSAQQAMQHPWFKKLLFPTPPPMERRAVSPPDGDNVTAAAEPAKRRKTGEPEESVNGSMALCGGTEDSSKENVDVNRLAH